MPNLGPSGGAARRFTECLGGRVIRGFSFCAFILCQLLAMGSGAFAAQVLKFSKTKALISTQGSPLELRGLYYVMSQDNRRLSVVRIIKIGLSQAVAEILAGKDNIVVGGTLVKRTPPPSADTVAASNNTMPRQAVPQQKAAPDEDLIAASDMEAIENADRGRSGTRQKRSYRDTKRLVYHHVGVAGLFNQTFYKVTSATGGNPNGRFNGFGGGAEIYVDHSLAAVFGFGGRFIRFRESLGWMKVRANRGEECESPDGEACKGAWDFIGGDICAMLSVPLGAVNPWAGFCGGYYYKFRGKDNVFKTKNFGSLKYGPVMGFDIRLGSVVVPVSADFSLFSKSSDKSVTSFRWAVRLGLGFLL